jgi:hypothetical protein
MLVAVNDVMDFVESRFRFYFAPRLGTLLPTFYVVRTRSEHHYIYSTLLSESREANPCNDTDQRMVGIQE